MSSWVDKYLSWFKKTSFVVSLICIALLIPVAYNWYISVPPLPVYGQMKSTHFIDNQGKEWEWNKATAGKIKIVSFFFTKCGGVCLKINKKMSQFHQSLQKRDDVVLISVSVDPDTDSPEVLTKYAQKYGADTQKWNFLTGEMDQIDKIAHMALVHTEGEVTFHSTKFVLIDHLDRIRGYYDVNEPEEIKKLLRHVSYLLKCKKKEPKTIKS